MNEDVITVDDALRAGACPKGIRRWFTARAKAGELPEGMTMRRFLREGMSVEMARSFNDGFINRVLDLREKRR